MSYHTLYKKMFKDYPDALTVKDLQQMLGIGKNLAYQLVNSNTIPHVKIGRKIIIAKVSIIEYLVNKQ